MSLLNERLERADPARAYDLLDPSIRDAVANLASTVMSAPPVRRKARSPWSRRTLIPVVAAAAVLAMGTVAGAQWLGAHTGLFGTPGATENDTSEWLRLGSPELRAIARAYGRAYPLPPGGSFEPAIGRLVHGEGLMQATGVRAMMARSSSCQWEREWLDARRASDPRRVRQALAVLADVPRWPVLRATDGGGVIALYRRVASAARRGDPGPVKSDLSANCAGLLP
jgi:hypothetical protein